MFFDAKKFLIFMKSNFTSLFLHKGIRDIEERGYLFLGLADQLLYLTLRILLE